MLCVKARSARLLADSEILWCLKDFNSLHCRVYYAHISILNSNKQWSIVSFFILQCLQREDERIEPLELRNRYKNA